MKQETAGEEARNKLNLEIVSRIEKLFEEMRILDSTLTATVDSAYNGNYDFKEYEWAFYGVVKKVNELNNDLKSLVDEVYALLRSGKLGENQEKAEESRTLPGHERR